MFLSALFLSILHSYAQLPINQFGGYDVKNPVELNDFLRIIEEMSLRQVVHDLHSKNTQHIQAALKTCALFLNNAEGKGVSGAALVDLIGSCRHFHEIMAVVYKQKAKDSEDEAKLLCRVGVWPENVQNASQKHLDSAAKMSKMVDRWNKLETASVNK